MEHRDDGAHLFRSRSTKDQAYALAQLAPAQLDRLLLPLGELDKALTREHARRLGLPVHDKAESQDICFVEGRDYRDVVAGLQPQTLAAGPVVTVLGERIGTHDGIASYTIGQRARLPASSDGPRYVARIDASTNTVVAGDRADLFARTLRANEVNLIRAECFSAGESVAVRAMIRYRAEPARALASLLRDGTLTVDFAEPQRAISPGQLVALFDVETEEVLGAATITSSS